MTRVDRVDEGRSSGDEGPGGPDRDRAGAVPLTGATPRQAAIEWLAVLSSGEVDAAERAAHAAWLDADPAHQRAWVDVQAALQRVILPVRAVDGAPVFGCSPLRTALERPRPPAARRRALRGIIGIGAAGIGVALWLGRDEAGGWLADQRTRTGERRRLTLDDGSELILNAGSAVDVDFSAAVRRLRLRAGDLLVTVAPDAGRPFIVATVDGEVRALGTRFMVRLQDGRSEVTVFEHRVRVDVPAIGTRTVGAGQVAWFDRSRLSAPAIASPGAAAWINGMVAVDDEPLSVVIDALRPYLRARVHLSEDAASLRVLGAFPLDSAETALGSLGQILPIRIRQFGPWAITISRTSANPR